MTFDPRLLPAFVTLAEELHFGRAAARLHLTQPTLSQQISRLEGQLGVELFKRSRRRVELSEAGALVLAPAQAAVEAAVTAAEAAAGYRTGEFGVIRLGVSPGAHYAAQALLAEVLTSGIRVRARQEPSALLAEHVATGELDVGIGFSTAPTAGVRGETLFEEQAVLAVASDHPLATRGRVSLADLDDEVLALVDERDGPGYNRAALAIVRTAGLELPTCGADGGPMAWENAVAAGCVGLTTRSAAHARLSGVRVLDLADRAVFSVDLLMPAETAEPRPLVARLCAAARDLGSAGRLVRAA